MQKGNEGTGYRTAGRHRPRRRGNQPAASYGTSETSVPHYDEDTYHTQPDTNLIRISKRYLRIGVTPEEYDAYDLDQRIRFVFLHGKDISRIVAYGIVRGPVLGRVLNRPVAWMLRELMTPDELAAAWRHRDYYRIGSSSEQDAALSEPDRERKRQEELKKGHTEPSHSLFGVVGQLATETGWSIDYILDKVNVVTLQLMMADMPHWVSPQKPDMMQQIREMEEREKQRNSHKQTENTNQTKRMNPMEFFTNYAVKD